MKKFITILSAGLLALTAVSCLKEEKAVFDASKATAPVLGTYNVGEEVITAAYTPAVIEMGFNEKMAQNHTLAIVAWNDNTASKTLSTSNQDNVLTLKTVNLAKALVTLGATEGSTVSVELAVRATLQDIARDNGVNGYIDSEEHIKISSFEVVIPEQVGSPYEEYTEASAWSLIGAMAAYEINWDGDLNMWATKDGNQHVAAHVNLKAGDEVKFRKDLAWTENMGGEFAAVGEEISVTQDGSNIKIAKDGVYDLFLDLSAGTAIVAEAYDPYPEYTQTTNWTVIGALSKLGINWDGDVDMVSDGTTSAAFSVAIAADDEFKFRQDKAWAVNLGGEFSGLDTDFAVTQDGANIKVGAEGVYDLFVNPAANTAKVSPAAGVKISTKIGANEPDTPDTPAEVTGWNIIGLNGDWDNDVLATEKDGVWTAYITAAEATAFKWRKDAGWDANYGIEDGATYTFGTAFAAVSGGKDISIEAGFYKVVLDLSDEANPTITIYDDFEVYSLIGDFNSWGGDVDMTETEAGIWVSPATKLNGGFKIRSAHAWDLSYGGTLAELGVAFDAISDNGPNITVPEEGEYVVTFDKNNLKITVEAAIPSNLWSLIGVNGDWNNDVFMSEVLPGVWVSPEVEITSAGWKIRFNHGWDVNRGGVLDAEGVFAKAVPGGNDINLTGKFKVVYNANNETIGTLVWGIVGKIASIDGFNWNNDVPMNLGSDGKWYSIPVTLAADDEIKIRQYAAWTVDRGGACTEANAAFEVTQGGSNIKAPAAGTYMLVYDPAAETITLSTDFWGLIGDFNSWDGDKFMLYDGAKWVAYGQALTGGWKIRNAAAWTLSVGGTFAEAGTPFAAVSDNGPNITVTGLDSFDIEYDTAAQTITVK